jgi:rubrerythrin
MGYDFSLDEIFEIACQIERTGAKFYRRMAKETPDSSLNERMLNLAAMEEAHEKVFASMKSGLLDQEKGKTVFDPDGETSQYLKAFADLFVFGEEAGEEFVFSELLSEKAKTRKILRAAINLEWEAIAFYSGMKDLVPVSLGKEKIDDIIKEEMKHVRLLTNSLIS